MSTTAYRRAAAAVLLALAGCAPSLGSSGGVVPSRDASVAKPSATAPVFRVFTAGSVPGLPKHAVPRDILIAPKGTIWFTDPVTPAIGRISRSFKIREFTAGLKPGAYPYSIVRGPDGNFWFSDQGGAIGRITPSGKIAEFRSPRMVNALPTGIAVGTDKAIWSIGLGPPSGGPSFIFRTTLTGTTQAFKIPSALIPDGSLVADASGNLWFVAFDANHNVFFVERTSQGKFVSYATGLATKAEPCCPNVAPKHLILGPDGNPWFTGQYFGEPGVMTPVVGTFAAQKATVYSIDKTNIAYLVYPSGIVSVGGSMWFAGSDPIGLNGALWHLTTSGAQVPYPIPYNPAGLTAADAETLWFTAQAQGKNAQIVEASF